MCLKTLVVCVLKGYMCIKSAGASLEYTDEA